MTAFCDPAVPAVCCILYVEHERDDVSVLYNIFLSFVSYKAFLFRCSHASAALHEFVIRYRLRPYESALEVGMDLSGCLRRLGALLDRPGSAFVFSCGQERDQVEQLI